MVETTRITLEVGRPAPVAAPLRPAIALPAVTLVDRPRPLLPSSTRERAFARAARLAHELIAGDPLLTVHTIVSTSATTPSRIEITPAG